MTPAEVRKAVDEVRRDNLEWRHRILSACKGDQELQHLVREKFQRDWLFAVNGFFWTFERVWGGGNTFRHSPMIIWPVQIKFYESIVHSINEGEDLLADKSRDMGATWGFINIYAWYWLQDGVGNDFLMGSRKEELVDHKRSMGTLFAKLRYLLKRLPKWLMPVGFKWKKHSTHRYLENPRTGSVIFGEACNPNFGSGDRRKSALLDEYSKWEPGVDEQAWVSLGDVTRARHALSTPRGMDGHFAVLRHGGQIKHFQLPWWEHPYKVDGLYTVEEPIYNANGEQVRVDKKLRSAWYDGENARRSPSEMAQEVDICYLTSGAPAFDRVLIGAIIDTVRAENPQPVFVGIIGLMGSHEDPTTNLISSPSGPLKIWEYPIPGQEYILSIDSSEGREGGDFCSISALNRKTLALAAEFHGLYKEHELATAGAALGYYYNRAWIVPEANSMGRAVIQHLTVVLHYPRVYRRRSVNTVTRKWTMEWGWKTTVQTWGLVRGAINDALDNGAYIPSLQLLEELFHAELRPTGRIEAPSGRHDDRVASYGIALAASATLPLEERIAQEMKSPQDSQREFEERVRESSSSDAEFFMHVWARNVLTAAGMHGAGRGPDRGNRVMN